MFNKKKMLFENSDKPIYSWYMHQHAEYIILCATSKGDLVSTEWISLKLII